MNLTNFSKIIIVDATSAELKVALCIDSKLSAVSQTKAQAMEGFFQALHDVCKQCNLSEIEAFALCTGTGSILGTRTASVGIATITKFTNAKIFEYNCMEVATFALADSGENNFSLFTPSRKGFANILNFNGAITLLKEIQISDIDNFAFDKKILLWQRDKVNDALAQFQTYKLDEQHTLDTLMQHPHLAHLCSDTPDAKSLTEREYVKWKAQVHI